MKEPRIDIWTIQHKGIIGGGKWKWLTSFAQGPRGAFQAEKFRRMEHDDNIRCYGTIGCGRTAAFIGEVEVTKALKQEYDRAIDNDHKSIPLDGELLIEKQKTYDRITQEIEEESHKEWEDYINSGRASAECAKD